MTTAAAAAAAATTTATTTTTTLFESQIILAEQECCTNWGNCKSNKSNQIKSNVGFCGEGKTEVPGEKPLGVENQQTQPTYDAGCGNRTWDTLVEGERSHHYTNPCPKPLLFAPLVIVRDKQTVHSGVGGKQTVHSGVGEGTRIKGQGCLLFLLWASKVVFTYIHTYVYIHETLFYLRYL